MLPLKLASSHSKSSVLAVLLVFVLKRWYLESFLLGTCTLILRTHTCLFMPSCGDLTTRPLCSLKKEEEKEKAELEEVRPATWCGGLAERFGRRIMHLHTDKQSNVTITLLSNEPNIFPHWIIFCSFVS